jgi:hypothetical protein
LKERVLLAGPNPYPLYSFRELRAVMGRPYIVFRAGRDAGRDCERTFARRSFGIVSRKADLRSSMS